MRTTYTTPKIRRGLAGEIIATTTTRHDGDPSASPVSFHGSAYGGPVVMAWSGGTDGQTLVDMAVRDRIGFPFGDDPAAWVRGFFQDADERPAP